MGTIACCREVHSYKTENSHLYQINRYVKCIHKESQLLPESQRETISSVTSFNSNIKNNFKPKNPKKQYLKNKKGEFQILSYDVEEEYFIEFKVTFPIIRTIEGMSELNLDKKLFLCGISPKQKNEGSFLLQINLDKRDFDNDDQINAEILINSHYAHIYPSLIHDNNEKILCVGGKGQTLCELYDLNTNKWFSLPQLPEERYKCVLCLDSKGDFVYLFGGIITDKDKMDDRKEKDTEIKILRMNLEKQLIWENLIIKNNQKNLIINRVSSGAFTFKYDEDFIFIVGGEDFDENYLDDVLRFSIKNLKFESTGLKLKDKAIFINQNGTLLNEQIHCLIDSFNNIHIIERHDCLPMDYHPDEI